MNEPTKRDDFVSGVLLTIASMVALLALCSITCVGRAHAAPIQQLPCAGANCEALSFKASKTGVCALLSDGGVNPVVEGRLARDAGYRECLGGQWRALANAASDTCTGSGPCMIGAGGMSTDGGLTVYGGAVFLRPPGGTNNSGFYSATNGVVSALIGGQLVWNFGSGGISPNMDNAIVNGSAGLRWANIYATSMNASSYFQSTGTASLPTCNAGLAGALEYDTTNGCLRECGNQNGSYAWSQCGGDPISCRTAHTADHGNLTTQTCNNFTITGLGEGMAGCKAPIVGSGCAVGATATMPIGMQLSCQFQSSDGGSLATSVRIERCCNGGMDCDPNNSTYNVTGWQ